ncbi:hypothetical protein CRYUN_Cryun15aG0042600 [Craigia yunnanensis]
MKILEVTRVTPSPNSPKLAAEFSLPHTFFDIFWFKLRPVERLFFYQLNELTLACFDSVFLPKLKQSLSLTLLHYLPLAGNLNNRIYEAVELHPLTPELITSDDSASTIALQITLFPNLGFCIGIAAHHAVLDGKTATLFMKSWANICKQGNRENSPLPPELTPFFDRNLIRDPDGLDMLYLNQWLTSIGSDSDTNNKSLNILPNKGEAPNLVRATFDITREAPDLVRATIYLNYQIVGKNFIYQLLCIHLLI